MKILIAGESWMTHAVHVKGFDSFTTSSYHEGVGPLRDALEAEGHEIDYLPNHVAPNEFPTDLEALRSYGVVVLSDIGANTLLLPDATFVRSERTPNRLHLIRDYVRQGGGLLMIGGYLTFQGIEGKGAYRGTAVEEVLPVEFYGHDDRNELPQGEVPTIEMADHPVVRGLADWPPFLGYNRSILRSDATLVASIEGDPFIAVRKVENGRSAIFASDCGPHWGPPEFLEWNGYRRMWGNLASWLHEG